MDALYKEFGRDLKKARREADLTQKQVADRVGLTRTSITNIERGNQHIALHQLFLLASAVGCHPTELLPDQTVSLEEERLPRKAMEELAEDEEGREFAAAVLRRGSGVRRSREETSIGK